MLCLEVKDDAILLTILAHLFLDALKLFFRHVSNHIEYVVFIVPPYSHHRVTFHGIVEYLRYREGDFEFKAEVFSDL